MNKLASSLLILSLFNTGVFAQTEDPVAVDRHQLAEQAIQTCQDAAQLRYGKDAIKSIANKAKWSSSLQGSTVNMKIKPQAKGASKYSCVVGMDSSVYFYKK